MLNTSEPASTRAMTRQADVFTLRELEEVESKGICEALGISTSNLWVLLHRARLRLIHCLKIRLEKEDA